MPRVADDGRRSKRHILERAVLTVAEQAAKANAIVHEAIAAGLDGSHPVTLQAKMLRLELLKVKGDLERDPRPARPRLLKVRPDWSMGIQRGRLARALGAPGAGAA